MRAHRGGGRGDARRSRAPGAAHDASDETRERRRASERERGVGNKTRAIGTTMRTTRTTGRERARGPGRGGETRRGTSEEEKTNAARRRQRAVNDAVREAVKRQDKLGVLNKDKEDRATVEQALDPRTMLILFKMLSRETFDGDSRCVSTGKEANVYHARSADGGVARGARFRGQGV